MSDKQIAKQVFGRTGHESTRIIFGAAALGRVTQAEADRTLDVLLEYGINHIDTAANYGDSELRIGPWMARHRKDFFLATKTQDRTYKEAQESIYRSLDRLRVNQIDLIQLHFLVDPQEWEVAMGPGGALEALIEARDQGLVKYIGVTGHMIDIARMHQKSLAKFDFDSILLPYSYVLVQNPTYASNFTAVTGMAKERNIAVQTIKSIVRRPWSEDASRHSSTWYEPLTEQANIDKAVWWVLGNPQVFLNTVGDIHLLPKVLNAASRFQTRPTEAEMQAELQSLAMAPLFT